MKNHTTQLFLAIALISLTRPALAASAMPEATPPDAISRVVTCHLLMTEQECGQFKTTLAQLNPGPALDQYLAAHNATMLEREAACSCTQKSMTGTTAYRLRKQALLRF